MYVLRALSKRLKKGSGPPRPWQLGVNHGIVSDRLALERSLAHAKRPKRNVRPLPRARPTTFDAYSADAFEKKAELPRAIPIANLKGGWASEGIRSLNKIPQSFCSEVVQLPVNMEAE